MMITEINYTNSVAAIVFYTADKNNFVNRTRFRLYL